MVFEFRNGVGLGLSTAKSLVEALGGFIFIETREHVGTQVTFGVPVETKARTFYTSYNLMRRDKSFDKDASKNHISTLYSGSTKKYPGKYIQRQIFPATINITKPNKKNSAKKPISLGSVESFKGNIEKESQETANFS